MKNKKIRIHIFSKDAGHRSEEFGWIRATSWLLVFLISLLGITWMIKEPDLYERLVYQNSLGGLKVENQALRKTLKEVRQKEIVLDSSLRELKGVVGKVSNLAGVVPDTLLEKPLMSSRDFLEEISFVQDEMEAALIRIEENKSKLNSLPVLYPVKHRYFISAGYEARLDPFTGTWLPHRGIDFPGIVGDTVVSTAHGQVVDVGLSKIHGTYIRVDHNNGLTTRYTHLSQALVKKGEQVKRGEPIALLGNSGRSTGAHLHYEIRFKDRLLNPKSFILPDTF